MNYCHHVHASRLHLTYVVAQIIFQMDDLSATSLVETSDEIDLQRADDGTTVVAKNGVSEVFWEDTLNNNLRIYVPPCLILCGTVMNILCLVVVVRTKSLRESSFGFLLGALAVADTLVLWHGLLCFWLLYLPAVGFDIR